MVISFFVAKKVLKRGGMRMILGGTNLLNKGVAKSEEIETYPCHFDPEYDRVRGSKHSKSRDLR